MKPSRQLAVTTLAALLLGPAGCGGSGTQTSTYPLTMAIVIPHADRFEPFVTEVAKGANVTFRNDDTDEHTVVSMPTDPVDFKFLVKPRQSVNHTVAATPTSATSFKQTVASEKSSSQAFNDIGIHPYFCDLHATWNADLKRVQARTGASEYPAAMEGVVFVLP